MSKTRTEDFVNVCQKLDQLRFEGTIDWGVLGENIHKNNTLTASTRLFLFWLCSLIDQFYPYRRIWIDGERAMLVLLKDNPHSFSDVNDKIVNLRKDRKMNTLGEIFFGQSKFTLVRDDYDRIKNSFDYLSQYIMSERNLSRRFVHLLGELIDYCSGDHGILKMAYFLDGRLFSNTRVTATPSSRELERFRDKPRKRLWMFLMFMRRDPSLLTLFREALVEIQGETCGEKLYETWCNPTKFNPHDLELPSDMWNQRLFNALIGRFDFHTKKSKKIARELATKYAISPSVFDVTFELGANKCRYKECVKCPFGDNGRCHKGERKFCSIYSWLFPYYTKNEKRLSLCNLEMCPIGQDLGKKLCSREINKNVKH